MTAIVLSPKSSNREVTSAFRALIAAEGQNQIDQRTADEAAEQDRNRFLEIATKLRLGAVVEGSSAERSSVDSEGTVEHGDDQQGE